MKHHSCYAAVGFPARETTIIFSDGILEGAIAPSAFLWSRIPNGLASASRFGAEAVIAYIPLCIAPSTTCFTNGQLHTNKGKGPTVGTYTEDTKPCLRATSSFQPNRCDDIHRPVTPNVRNAHPSPPRGFGRWLRDMFSRGGISLSSHQVMSRDEGSPTSTRERICTRCYSMRSIVVLRLPPAMPPNGHLIRPTMQYHQSEARPREKGAKP